MQTMGMLELQRSGECFCGQAMTVGSETGSNPDKFEVFESGTGHQADISQSVLARHAYPYGYRTQIRCIPMQYHILE